MKYLKILLPFILILSFTCKEPELPFFPLDEEMKAYFTIGGEGSLYIYQDSVSGALDSVYIIRNSNTNSNNFDHIGEGYLLLYDCQMTKDFRTDIRTNEKRYQFEVVYNSGSSHKVIKENDEYKPQGFVTIKPSVKIHGKEFSNVLQVEGNGLFYLRFQFAPNIGCIMKESTSPTAGKQIWKLIEHHIKK